MNERAPRTGAAEADEFELDLASLLDSPSPGAAPDPFLPKRKARAPEGEKYVVFHLDDMLYAVHAAGVAEVIGSLPVTPLPPVAAERAGWLAGVANLRGSIIPVVDLRKLWKKQTAGGAPVAPAAGRSKLLVMRSGNGSAAAAAVGKNSHRSPDLPPAVAAFVVDKLSEMITLAPGEVEFSAADFESSFPTFFGRAARGPETIFLLDSENLFSSLAVNG